ncbi:WD repeat-containing protein 54-like [Haliotis rubra]|uniref:WD repeat-containing protein 54-like n=1 Tax=Haliotis rubra TaxID=36100 RepID=UPI001EE56B2E|nr:WD repeat-containing protein 54-like [Haliotis rubra]
MYRKEKPVVIKGSASSLPNNLSILATPEKGSLNYAVVHKSTVNLVTATTDGTTVTGRQVVCKEPTATQGSPFITQVKWIILPVRTVLILTSQRGIQMFEPDGSVMIYWHALSDCMDSSNFGRGISGVGDNLICVGTESGLILVFNMPPKGTNITYQEALKGHTCAICDLASDKDTMVSGDERGSILVWKAMGQQLQQTVKITGGGSPCSSIALWRGIIVGGYGSGHLRVYSAASGKISAEVTAHARWINAIDIARENGMLLSVSDDASYRVWKLTEGTMPQIQYRHSDTVTDVQLVGGQFVDGQGRALCLTGYDCSEIVFFVQC